MTLNKETKQKRLRWYKNKQVQFELINAMKDREVCIMSTNDRDLTIVRGLYIKNTTSLNWIMDYFDFIYKDLNFYISNAKYKNIPKFTYKFKERNQDTRHWFRNNACTEIYDYDIFLDFDIDNLNDFTKMKKEVINIAKFLESENIPFYLMPSGTGFHIIIDSKVLDFEKIFKNNLNEESFNKKTKQFIYAFKERFDLEFLDTKGIGVYNKIRKCPYSLVKSFACIPDFINALDKRHYTLYDSEQVIETYELGFRGIPIYNNIHTEREQKENFKEFCKKYILEF